MHLWDYDEEIRPSPDYSRPWRDTASLLVMMLSLSDLTDEKLAKLTPDQIARSGENKGPLTIAICASVLSVAAIFCALRFYVRLRIVRSFGKDDWAVLVALAGVVAFTVLLVSKCHYGLGRHIWLLTDEDNATGMKITTAYLIIYQFAFSSIKTAFLLQYRRVFPLPSFQRVCSYILIFVVLFTISQVIVIGLGCIPLEKLWHYSVQGKCVDRVPFWYFNSVVHLVTDLTIIVLPMPLLHMLPLRFVQKAILMGVFGLGFFVAGISIIRITYLIPAAVTTDFSYDTISSSLWSVGEVCCALVCLCIPTLRPLMRRVSGSATRSNMRTGEYSAPQSGYRLDLERGGDAPLHVRKFRMMEIDTLPSDDGCRRVQRPVGGSAGSVGNVSHVSGISAATGTTTSSGRSGHDTFWLAEESELERAEPIIRTALSPPPRSVASPVEERPGEEPAWRVVR